ncbi:MAG TPA: hypothetical protein QGF58_10820 [Myxococcota bacterium]|nr:hypothetical protein [Myxococcota bacterium]
MSRFAFEGLYLAVLTLCVGAVEFLRIGAPDDEAPIPPQTVAEIIAVPPKPEGARAAEGVGDGPGYSEEACRAIDRDLDLRDACWRALAVQRAERDPEGALEACREVRFEEDLHACYADVAELHSTVDREWSEEACETLIPVEDRTWHGQCWFGIALAHSTLDPDYARDTCERALDWKNFCRHDVNGEIAQYDPDNAFSWCQTAEMTPLQLKGCYHGLGKYLGRVDVPKALEICRRVPTRDDIHPQQCFHGLGWALSESDLDAAISTCKEEGGAYADSCRLGVSANVKRFDPEHAVEICGAVSSPKLKKNCLKFAER